MDIQTDHQVVTFGNDKMMLFDSATGNVIVNAARDASTNTWTITATGIADVAAIGRSNAVTAMTEQALAALKGTGYSTLVPNAVWDLP